MPGVAYTEVQNKASKESALMALLTWALKPTMQSAEDGSLPLLECMCGADLKEPAFYGPRDTSWPLGSILKVRAAHHVDAWGSGKHQSKSRLFLGQSALWQAVEWTVLRWPEIDRSKLSVVHSVCAAAGAPSCGAGLAQQA